MSPRHHDAAVRWASPGSPVAQVIDAEGTHAAPPEAIDVSTPFSGDLETMAAASFDPLGHAARHAGEGRPVVGIIGFDVPHELVVAAGMVPVRLRADPGVDPQRFGDLSAMALDPIATCHLVRLLNGDFDCLDRLIVSHDRGPDAKLFFVLRELGRLGELPERPSVSFLDIRHLPSHATAEYNRTRIGELATLLEEWAGHPFSRSEVVEATALCNANRRLLKSFQSLRTDAQPRFSGVDSLAAIGAALVMDKGEYQATMSRLLAGAEDRSGIDGVRVFASGSGAEDASLYRAIESAGALVVGEDHDFGDRSFEQLVPETDDPLDGIVQAYGGGAPAASWGATAARAEYTTQCAGRSGAEAVLSVLFDHDAALGWDRSAARRALAEVNIPLIEIETPWGAPTEAVEGLVRSFVEGGGGVP